MVVSNQARGKVIHEEWCPDVGNIKKEYRKFLSREKAHKLGYHECKYCGGIHGLYLKMMRDPEYYGKNQKHLKISYDRVLRGVCFRTNVGFWRATKDNHDGRFFLYHLNSKHFEKGLKDRVLMRREFHRQIDVKPTIDLRYIIDYIDKHDKAKQIIRNGGYRDLPKSTKKQRKYYEQQKKKARRKSIRRVDDLFKQLERERKGK